MLRRITPLGDFIWLAACIVASFQINKYFFTNGRSAELSEQEKKAAAFIQARQPQSDKDDRPEGWQFLDKCKTKATNVLVKYNREAGITGILFISGHIFYIVAGSVVGYKEWRARQRTGKSRDES